MITAQEFINENIPETCIVLPEWLIDFAKIHVMEALKQASENVSLKLSSSEEINDKNISPFITSDDKSIWIIDKTSILNLYSLDNVE